MHPVGNAAVRASMTPSRNPDRGRCWSIRWFLFCWPLYITGQQQPPLSLQLVLFFSSTHQSVGGLPAPFFVQQAPATTWEVIPPVRDRVAGARVKCRTHCLPRQCSLQTACISKSHMRGPGLVRWPGDRAQLSHTSAKSLQTGRDGVSSSQALQPCTRGALMHHALLHQ